jgi:hypothetical protein
MITIQWLHDFSVRSPSGEVVRAFKQNEKIDVSIRLTGMWTTEGQAIKGIRQGEDFIFIPSYSASSAADTPDNRTRAT